VPAVAYELSSRQPATYSSFADVYVNQQNIASSLSGIGTTFSGASTVVTQASLAGVPEVAKQALAIAKLHDRSPGALLAQTSISPNTDVSMLRFTVVDRSPATAALLATSRAGFHDPRQPLESQPIVRARANLSNDGHLAAGMEELDAPDYEEKDQHADAAGSQTSGTALWEAALGGQIGPRPRKKRVLGIMLGIILGLASRSA
jgi:hypothetical protein